MSKKNLKEKGSSNSKKETSSKKEEVDLNEYEDSYDGEFEEKTSEEEVDYEEYELPDDFVKPEDAEKADEKLSWIQKRKKDFIEMDNYQRLYWIKVLSGTIAGIILGLVGAQTAWWLFLMVGLYGAITAGGFFLFKLKWNWKEILFSGFFPFVALFWMFWTLMFTSLYAPSMEIWQQLLVITETITTNNSTYVTTYTNTTTAAGFPFLTMIFIVVATLGVIQFLLRKYKRNN
ncbi:MAG: EMC6 family protein [Candidatus Thorarchaeota archaeon]